MSAATARGPGIVAGPSGDADAPGRGRARWLRPALRLATLALCLGLAAAAVDLDRALAELRGIPLSALLLATALQAAIVVALSVRWRLVARAAGASLPLPAALRMTFMSTLANLLLPTSLAGDAGRVWIVRHHGLDLRRGAMAGVFDRAVGLVTLGALALAGAAAAPGLIPGSVAALLWAMLAAGVAAAALGAGLARRADRAGRSAPALGPLRPGPVLGAVALSLLGHGGSVAIAVVLARGMGAPLAPGEALALFPAVLLAASIPASVGGWGLRELAAIAVFPLAGMTAAAAMALTLAFGLTQLAAAGLGSLALAAVPSKGGRP